MYVTGKHGESLISRVQLSVSPVAWRMQHTASVSWEMQLTRTAAKGNADGCNEFQALDVKK